MRVNSNLCCQTAIYDYASDPSGGAVGSVALTLSIPAYSILVYYSWYLVVPFTSSNLASSTVDFTPWTNDLRTNVRLFSYVPNPMRCVDVNINGLLWINSCGVPPTLTASPNNLDYRLEIGGTPITGGRALFSIMYMQVSPPVS